MKRSVIVIGDVHGCFKTLVALLNKIPDIEKHTICFVGDLIDRGPSSKQVIDFVINNNYKCVMGNHEKMMIDKYPNTRALMDYDKEWWLKGLWMMNGGIQTMNSYKDNSGEFDFNKIEEHIDFINKLPTYIEFKDIRNSENRHLIVSHSHMHMVWNHIKKGTFGPSRNDIILWNRNFKVKCQSDMYNIIGHTPVVNKPRITKIYADIDTGCYYTQEPGYGILSAIQYPEMTVFQQKNIDNKID